VPEAQGETEPGALADDRCQDTLAASTAAALSAVTFLRVCPGAGWFHRKHGTASA